jgi:multisubunit Na+/H+ antiporter MnhC subunit
MDWLSLMLGGTGRGWLEAALLLGLFWAALVQPERIKSILMFRLSGLFLGLAVIAPTLIQVFLIGQRQPGVRPVNGEGMELAMYASAIPPVLTMLAIVIGLDSVMPRKQSKSSAKNAADGA